ncbi:MAG: DUF2914 domain-containing protein [Candidatus Doudnabacteria bacterium]|nr:DUF2914 domain-containing protein [Candidatus Doudnabacteria bacterium]
MQDENQKYSRLTKIRSWYGKYERLISSWSLICGFVFDAVTLKRVDLFWENFWVIAHLTIVGTAMVLVHAIEKGEGDETNPSKLHFWLVNIVQFFFGGILSTYLVFYFRSGDITVTWPFLLILALCFWANEALKRHFVRLAFQISLFFLSIMCFAIYLVPVFAHQIGPDIFLLSGVYSLVFIALFLLVIRLTSKEEFAKSQNIVYACIGGIFILVNTLYFTNLIPPLPVSMKEAGIYYSIRRDNRGNYQVSADSNNGPWYELYPDIHKKTGQPLYVYSAIFSPADFNMNIVHEWQFYDINVKQWETESKIPLTVIGGRDGGFRTYSEKFNPAAGHWRVNVLTENGQLIGRVRFNVVLVDQTNQIMQSLN